MAQPNLATVPVLVIDDLAVWQTNRLPPTDPLDNPTGCCPRFHPDRWNGQALRFEGKRFARTLSRNVTQVHDMLPTYAAAASTIEKAHAWEHQQILVLNRSLPGAQVEHLFAVGRDVPGMQMVSLDGLYRTAVYEGAYHRAALWQELVRDDLAQRGETVDRLYLYYTTCPACAEQYGSNYVVVVAKVAD